MHPTLQKAGDGLVSKLNAFDRSIKILQCYTHYLKDIFIFLAYS